MGDTVVVGATVVVDWATGTCVVLVDVLLDVVVVDVVLVVDVSGTVVSTVVVVEGGRDDVEVSVLEGKV